MPKNNAKKIMYDKKKTAQWRPFASDNLDKAR